ncbi:MAG: glycosyltransferase family 4 protein [Anaerolineae bacterium]
MASHTPHPLHIVVDYSAAIHQGAGIGRYTRSLVTALLAQDSVNRYTLLHARTDPASREALTSHLPPNARTFQIGLPLRWFTLVWYRWRLPLPLQGLVGPWDLYHSPNFTLPRLRGGRSIVTIHDLSFLRVPQFAEPRLRRYLMVAVPKAVRQADGVLADSATTRRDIQDLLGVPPTRIQVIHAACDGQFRRVTDATRLDEARHRLVLPARYILSVGTLEPRKNFEGLIRAYALLLQERPHLPHHLVVAGRPGWLGQGTLRAVEETGLAGRIHVRQNVEDEDLPALYSMADLFVFPSWYEGFGLPPLEAMACGVPVIASDRGSLPEVLGDAARYMAPEDLQGIARAIAELLDNSLERDRLAQRGLKQAGQFSWARSAEKLLAVYQQLAGSGPGVS